MHFIDKDKHKLKGKGFKILSSKWSQKQALISDKVDFKPKLDMRQTKSFYIDKENKPSRGCNNCKHICTECGVPNFIKQILLDIKTQTPNIIKVSGFSIPLSPLDWPSR
jgi:hypothetical protein